MQIFQTTINENGRIVIPAALRAKLELKAGDKLIFNLSDDDEITIENPAKSLSKLRKILKQKNKNNLSQELIDMRRNELI